MYSDQVKDNNVTHYVSMLLLLYPTTLVNPCSTNLCNGGSCSDQEGVAVCDCSIVTGYGGVRCDEDINECTEGHECQNSGICQNTVGDYTCTCDNRFIGNRCQTGLCI